MAIEINNPQTPATKPQSSGDLLDRIKGGLQTDAGSLFGGFSRGMTEKDRMFFTEQLALLLETGTSLLEALKALRRQTQTTGIQSILDDIIANIQEGKTFSDSLKKHPKVFSTTYINLVSASENGGFMPQVLNELLEMDDKRARLQSTIKSALSYPVFLMLFSLAVVIFVLVVVFPKFADMFASIQDQLPASTKILMWTSHFLIDNWYVVVGGTVLILFASYRWLVSQQGSMIVDGLKLRTPFIKNIFMELYLVQSFRVMSLSLGNGVSVMDTLAACRDVVSNKVYQEFIRSVELSVQEGQGFAQGFNQSDFIPIIVRQMVTTGENSGSLPKILLRISSYYERQLENRLNVLAKAAEPLMLLVMGVVVGLLVSSLILPIFKLSKAVG